MASINLTWTASTPAPINGYRVKYWPTASPLSVTTAAPNPTGTSYSIINLAAGVSYSGTIEASCSGGTYSTPVNWSVTASGGGGGSAPVVCYSYLVTADDGTSNRDSFEFTYTNCAGGPMTRNIVNLGSVTVCARMGTILSDSSAISAEQGSTCS